MRRLLVIGATIGLLLAMTVPASAALAKASVDRVEGPFETVVPIALADNPSGVELMFAECDFVERVEKPDGSSVETQQCHLTEPFVVFPGTPPESAFTLRTDGPCIWFSDYFAQTTGESP
jgi:hypothetical protein